MKLELARPCGVGAAGGELLSWRGVHGASATLPRAGHVCHWHSRNVSWAHRAQAVDIKGWECAWTSRLLVEELAGGRDVCSGRRLCRTWRETVELFVGQVRSYVQMVFNTHRRRWTSRNSVL